MRISNKPGDATIGENGIVKVDRNIVGLCKRLFFPELGMHFYFFDLADGKGPVVMSYYRHEFRAAIGEYVRKHNVPPVKIDGAILKPANPKTDECERQQQARKSRGAKYGHIKRRLVRNEPLSGKSLELALQLVGEHSDIGKKLIAGEPLGDYDLHYVVDVILVHARLA